MSVKKKTGKASRPKRDVKARMPANNRTKAGNGTGLFIDGVKVDGRTGLARRYREHVVDLAEQVGGEPTAGQEILIRNAATLATLLEVDQAKVASGQPIDDDLNLKRVASVVSILRLLGVKNGDAKPNRVTKVIDGHTAALLSVA